MGNGTRMLILHVAGIIGTVGCAALTTVGVSEQIVITAMGIVAALSGITTLASAVIPSNGLPIFRRVE